ncbi:MAG: monooxygenase family protein [Burkholderiales bacterium]
MWHETYATSPGSHESVYLNMPPFGAGRAVSLQGAVGGRQSAASRLGATPREP